MAAPPQTQQQGGDASKRQALIGVNDLNYVLPPDLSVSVIRTHTNHYFQQAEYENNQRAICILNTGAHYIDTRQSSLEFGIRLPGNAAVGGYFGINGSALNLIDSITVTSRAGDEICRIDQADLLHYVTTPYKFNHNWINTVGQGMGFGDVVPDPGKNLNTIRYSIPLYAMTEFFAYGRLLPPMIASGLRVSISWSSAARAFCARQRGNGAVAAGALTSYTIENPYMSTFAHQLSDGVQRDLNELSATNGLELVYCDWEPTEISYANTANLTAQLEVRKAASRALQVLAVTRPTAEINNGLADSYATITPDFQKYQWQLGSLYFPQQPVIANGSVGATGTAEDRAITILPEAYKHTLISFGSYKSDSKQYSGVPFKDSSTFLENQTGPGTADAGSLTTTPTAEIADAARQFVGMRTGNAGKWGTFANGLTVIGQTLERTDLFNMSGIPINNARVLSFRTTYEANAATTRTLTIFLKYVRLARCFLNNVEVEQ